jgi:16S rRNA (cytosine1402-N4)-methyltransferase
MSYFYHEPVLLKEAIEWLVTDKNGIYVDATLGGGGHTLGIFELYNKPMVIGFDEDIDAINYSEKKLKVYKDRFMVINRNFSEIYENIEELKYTGVISGIIFDLGISSFQIDNKEKGFMYREDSPLDMRMNKLKGISASEFLNSASEIKIAQVFYEYGEERKSKILARKLTEVRKIKQIKTSNDFIEIVRGFYKPYELNKNLSRLFQALRIEINNELENLKIALKKSLDILMTGGRIVVITYHSLEDRIVKNFFKEYSRECNCPTRFPQCVCGANKRLNLINKKPIIPTELEIGKNVRARSAKMRVAEKK